MGRKRRKRQRNKRPPTLNPSYLSTLCWCCAKATTGGCSWSANFIPVEGWEATPTVIKEGSTLHIDENNNIVDKPRISHSFKVHKCPEFIEDCKPNELGLQRKNNKI